MAVRTAHSPDGTQVTIAVNGRFDFTVHEQFRVAYERSPKVAARYVVDLSATEYVDSSALGMLLLLREHAGGHADRVSIKGARPEVRRVLTIANFHKLFALA
jgi:anti-anti-sigma factor